MEVRHELDRQRSELDGVEEIAGSGTSTKPQAHADGGSCGMDATAQRRGERSASSGAYQSLDAKRS